MNKIKNIKDMKYFSNMELLSTLVLKAIKKKPTETLSKMSKAIVEVTFYVNELQSDRWAYDKALSDYRADKNRAIERARKVEKKNEDLQIIIKKYEQFVR
jgi:hypothetical protein